MKVSVKTAADEMNYSKRNYLWWSDLYLHLLDDANQELGTNVYLGDGVMIAEKGVTGKKLVQIYKDNLELA
jgi:hypothetical protein